MRESFDEGAAQKKGVRKDAFSMTFFVANQVLEASKILWIELSIVASNSSLDC